MKDPSSDEVLHLSDEEVFAVVHHLGFVIRDAGLLASAAARPRGTVLGEDAYPDIAGKAAALFESVLMNHALVDGNKRLGVVLTWTMLMNNGYTLVHSEDEAYEFTMHVAAGSARFPDIRDWFAGRPRPDDQSS